MRTSRLAAFLLALGGLAPRQCVAAPAECESAAAAAEQAWGVPSGLIAAIGRVESGRYDGRLGRDAPQPFAVDAGGSGRWFDTREEAAAFVRDQQARGVRLIDVGCFQIDLFYHPEAFGSLDAAFDPAANADYAARLLTVLRRRTGDWNSAVAAYHAAGDAGRAYLARVAAFWPGGPQSPETLAAPRAQDLGTRPTTDRIGPRDAFVILMSASARAVRIWRPDK